MIKAKIAVACGGTGGHIFPGLAVANVLLKKGYDVTIWIAGKDIENEAISGWQGKVVEIKTEGFQYGFSIRSLKTIFKLVIGIVKAFYIMKKTSPNVVLAMGSYASIAPCLAAKYNKIPYILHEANTVPGRAVNLLSNNAKYVATAFEDTKYYFQSSNIIHTGMPLRESISNQLSNDSIKNNDNYFTILVTGGSRGAEILNLIIPKVFCKKIFNNIPIKIIHIIGKRSVEEYESLYNSINISAEVYSFVHNIEKFYSISDLVIARSGASTCAEICAFGLPSILIPYPYAIHDHQMKNARILEAAGASYVICQDDINEDKIADYIYDLIKSPEKINFLKRNAKQISQIDADEKLVDLIELTISKN